MLEFFVYLVEIINYTVLFLKLISLILGCVLIVYLIKYFKNNVSILL